MQYDNKLRGKIAAQLDEKVIFVANFKFNLMDNKNEILQIKGILIMEDFSKSFLTLLFEDKKEEILFYDFIKYGRLKLCVEENPDKTISLVFRFFDNNEKISVYNTGETTLTYSSLFNRLQEVPYITTGSYEVSKVKFNLYLLPSPFYKVI